MADGDTYTILYGKRSEAIRIAIDKATATTHTLVAAVAGKKIRVIEALIMLEGAGSTAYFHEESSVVSIFGDIEAITGSTATVIDIDEDDGVQTATANKAFQITLSVTLPISGYVVYQLIDG